MFIPLKDSTLRIYPPFITVNIIFINIVIYLYQSSLSPLDQRTLIYTAGVVAWFAHIGGFLSGIALLFILEP